MTYKNLWKPSLLSLSVFVLCGCILPASASERLCDASFEDCRAPMLKLIQQENVEIDVAFWFIDDPAIGSALTKKIQAGVKVRMLVDPRSEDAHSGNTSILQQFAALTPPVPMRKRIASSILHWKMMLFAGQGIVGTVVQAAIDNASTQNVVEKLVDRYGESYRDWLLRRT